MTQKDMVCVQEKLSLQSKVELRIISVSYKPKDKNISGYARGAGVSAKLNWSNRLE